MLPLSILIAERLKKAIVETYPTLSDREITVRRTDNPRFGDYQSEFALSIAKTVGQAPLQIAQTILAKVDRTGLLSNTEAVKPGFMNLTVSTDYLGYFATSIAESGLTNTRTILSGKKIVLDYSSPNVAKSMHIGHFRATITGDALCRMLRHAGASVISDNHIGDWGTQFGKLIVSYNRWSDLENYSAAPVKELERLYQKFEKEKTDELENSARNELVKLQQGDPDNTRLWREFTAHSLAEFNAIYSRLGIQFDYIYGESHYNSMLPKVASTLENTGIAFIDQGALIVDTETRYQIHGPVIVRKQDGGFGYAATDLATLMFRLDSWHPDEIIYVTDSRQRDHFKSVFAIFSEWQKNHAMGLRHVFFGSIKAPDGRSFSTREGNVVLFNELLDEAITRARQAVEQKNPSLSEAEKKHIADIVGIASLKYAELNHDLKTDTLFDWNRMLSFEGNTAPYLLYTYARARSVIRKHDETFGSIPLPNQVNLQVEQEKNMLLMADSFPIKLAQAVSDLKPNHITEYVYLFAAEFNVYYNRNDCPILREADAKARISRLFFYHLVCNYLRTCLQLLGIETLEKM
ncbi:MAG: arginine--tRNA ligase [Elusimicrobia bacterium RIFOXYB2_FULL_49_7]|nr:MAG: arginine--tRNA ligase [Elusimicrobia bacterium RIFOXYB2_FULL_49_7]